MTTCPGADESRSATGIRSGGRIPRSRRLATTGVRTALPCRAICGRWLDRISAAGDGSTASRWAAIVMSVPGLRDSRRWKGPESRVEKSTLYASRKTPPFRHGTPDRAKRYPGRITAEIRQTAPAFRSCLGRQRDIEAFALNPRFRNGIPTAPDIRGGASAAFSLQRHPAESLHATEFVLPDRI